VTTVIITGRNLFLEDVAAVLASEGIPEKAIQDFLTIVITQPGEWLTPSGRETMVMFTWTSNSFRTARMEES
jgi:hypothetical protein